MSYNCRSCFRLLFNASGNTRSSGILWNCLIGFDCFAKFSSNWNPGNLTTRLTWRLYFIVSGFHSLRHNLRYANVIICQQRRFLQTARQIVSVAPCFNIQSARLVSFSVQPLLCHQRQRLRLCSREFLNRDFVLELKLT